jgi:hypothetical protein
MIYRNKDVAGTGARGNKDSGSDDNTDVLLYYDTSAFRHTNNYWCAIILI